jgi:hypothetical protein
MIKFGPLLRKVLKTNQPVRAFTTEAKKEPKHNMNRPYQKPDFLDDDYDHLSKEGGLGKKIPADLDDDDFLPDYLAKDAPTYKRNEVSINLPWLINGAPFNEIKTRFMGEQIFAR